MLYKIGLVGLPNVGKSSLFNWLSSSDKAKVAPFPFSTLQPLTTTIPLEDPVLDQIYDLISWRFKDSLSREKFLKKNACFELVDIAGIVPLDGLPAHSNREDKKSELGSSFLAHIRSVKMILLVVRAFINESVSSELKSFVEEHPEYYSAISSWKRWEETSSQKVELRKTKEAFQEQGILDRTQLDSSFSRIEGVLEAEERRTSPMYRERIKDSETVMEAQLVLLSLISSDLELLDKMISKYSKDQRTFEKELKVLIPIREELKVRRFIPISLLPSYSLLKENERNIVDRLSLLSSKKIVIVGNYGSSDQSLEKLKELREWSLSHSFAFASINLEGEEFCSLLTSEEEKKETRESPYLRDSSEEKLLKTILVTLGLKSFYTFRLEDEKRKKYSLSNLSWEASPVKGELRSWFFHVNDSLQECAARIHNDFADYFVSARILESSKFLGLDSSQNVSSVASSVSKSFQLKGGEIVQIVASAPH
ncbi:GTP-binding protein YchF [Candidatus Mycoplasma haematolamae str. Purdue]|uniref:GTP-binding protein YchF n=1 Tax=Mycoplasma haematolamae (strain Purdue) TaxID=1212765 RepID=I7CID3_MYCHA|nr:DUF933 domain-containing protein [Candidatus Mycoplasma haematolamae]AFO51609.1 GTP-binding protein YchF [Candidatus Mycoplasma haematolamae str. Purdue]